jgi:hypothetical protein
MSRRSRHTARRLAEALGLDPEWAHMTGNVRAPGDAVYGGCVILSAAAAEALAELLPEPLDNRRG